MLFPNILTLTLGLALPMISATAAATPDASIQLGKVASDNRVLDHFISQGSRPERIRYFDDGSWEELYSFDTPMWDAAAQDLLNLFHSNETAFAELVVDAVSPQDIVLRDNIFYNAACYQASTWAYNQVVAQIIPPVCGGFIYTSGYLARTQVARRMNVPGANNDRVQLVFKWVWLFTSYASQNSCGGALNKLLSQYCEVRVS